MKLVQKINVSRISVQRRMENKEFFENPEENFNFEISLVEVYLNFIIKLISFNNRMDNN